MHRFIAPAAGIFLATASLTATAATVIELRGVDSGQPIANDIVVDAGWVRITVEEDGTVTEVLYDSTSDTAYVVDHQEKSYTALTEQGIEQIGNQLQAMMSQVQAQLEQTMGNMTEAQKAQLGNVLGNMGMGQGAQASPPRQAEFNPIGGSREVNGIPCTEGIMSVDGIPSTQLCIAEASDLPLADGDYDTLRKLASFGGRIAGKVASIFPAVSMSLPSFDIASISGLPVEVRDGAMQVAVTSIRQADQPAIAVPEGYSQRVNPMLGQQ